MPLVTESERWLRPAFAVDLRRTLRVIGHGGLDPTLRVGEGDAALGLRTPDGPAQLRLRSAGAEIEATAWGAGAGWALDHAPGIAGCEDHAEGFSPADPRLAELWRRLNGARIPRTTLVAQALLSVVLGQRVTTGDAASAYRGLVKRWGEPAPGPDSGVWVPPDPAVLAAQAYFAFHPLGIERNRAETLRRVAGAARRLDALAAEEPAEAQRRMQLLPGIGPWSAGTVALFALGDPDAVAVGDLHLKHLVCWALAGERWGTDERMLDLLAPYAGQRGRICRLIVVGGAKPPARRPVPSRPSGLRRSG